MSSDEDFSDPGQRFEDERSPQQRDEADSMTDLSHYEVRLRRTEHVRTVLHTRSSIRIVAPERLVVRIRESLLIVDGPRPRRSR